MNCRRLPQGASSRPCRAHQLPADDAEIIDAEAVVADELPAGFSFLGTAALGLGAVLALLTFAEITGGLPFAMPRSWYVSRPLWHLLTVGCFVAAWMLLRGLQKAPAARRRRFKSVVLYTRSGCHLCDDAKATLAKYGNFLPPAAEIDIDTDPQLVEAYGTCVPVIKIDGVVRFRGRINEMLLRRLIENAADSRGLPAEDDSQRIDA